MLIFLPQIRPAIITAGTVMYQFQMQTLKVLTGQSLKVPERPMVDCRI